MRLTVLSGVLLLLSVDAHGQSPPRIVPLYSALENAPAVMLECVNRSAANLDVSDFIETSALRVDGQVHEITGGITGSFLGGPPVFLAGQSVRVMIPLKQRSGATWSADLGAVLRSPWTIPLQPGQHTLAVRCLGNWSDELDFYWEDGARFRGTDPVEEITAIEQRLARAWVQRDRPAIESILREDWTTIDTTGRLLTRTEVLREAFEATDRIIDTMSIDDLNVRILGDTAVVTGRTSASGRYRGKPVHTILRFTDVFSSRDGRWRIVASQGTQITQ
jgi:ketosteroid isomerase-like protein